MMNTALITGASAGLGREMARCFAQRGYDLVLTARNEQSLYELKHELEVLYGVKARVFVLDLNEPKAAQKLFAFTEEEGIRVDVLVNNAGFGDFGLFVNSVWEKQLSMMQVNMVALTELCYLYGGKMADEGRGKILNVASLASFMPGPLMSVYYATKNYVRALSEALYVELKPFGVSVTALCPGPTRTGFEKRAGLDNSKLFQTIPVGDARTVARKAVAGAEKGKALIIPGFLNYLGAMAASFMPPCLVREVVYRMQKIRE